MTDRRCWNETGRRDDVVPTDSSGTVLIVEATGWRFILFHLSDDGSDQQAVDYRFLYSMADFNFNCCESHNFLPNFGLMVVHAHNMDNKSTCHDIASTLLLYSRISDGTPSTVNTSSARHCW